ncbi:hypothetical protein [Desulfopila aestuarii]|uniref:Transglycosylase SLT domain-containing protein n=1 Tax=Desulfopila aestuarii DSM 18488 TaxID=1121416 RepID=A0A1M7YJ66_9BACT|nr:hypothetical protein [Desulfopila aestuarii]SHO52631.1 hypothetical protein SAMN02745220_04657 [Desulfopila aestuarii DSM 18488]
MKTTALFFFALVLICFPNMTLADQPGDRFDNNPNLKTDIEMEQEKEPPPTCFAICTTKISEICSDEITKYQQDADGNSPWAVLYEAKICQEYCNSEWNDDVLRCMNKAQKCSSLTWANPYCEEEVDIYEQEPEEELNYSCSAACYKYKVCALKAGGASVDDGNSAYNTCFEECQNWSPETVRCIVNTDTGTGMGCYQMTSCAMKEYSKMIRMMQNGSQLNP